MSFFVAVLIFLAIRRLGARGFRMRPWHGRRGHWHSIMKANYRRGVPLQTPASAPSIRPAETAYDVLKKRYVKGELSDDQYERALDDLLKTPEGRVMMG